jgi:hypothetical protein
VRSILLAAVSLISVKNFSQKNICGYYNFPCEGCDIGISLTLKEDSFFDFQHFHMGFDSNCGRWKTSGDALVLYDYLQITPRIDTLKAEEFITEKKDSIEIVFIDHHTHKPCP